MIKMLKLDWLAMKVYWKRIVILPIFITLYGLLSESLILPLLTLFMLAFSINPFAVEEKGKLDNLYLTLPITRKTIVKTRYCLSFIIEFAGLIFGIIVTYIMSFSLNGRNVFYMHNFKASFETIALLICCCILFYAIANLAMFPTLFKIGYAHGKAIGFYIPIFSLVVIAYVIYLFSINNKAFGGWMQNTVLWSKNNPLIFCIIVIALAVVILYISYSLSKKFYFKRNL